MARSHGNERYKVFGVEVDKLHNSRYRIEIKCDVSSRDQDWYYNNLEGLFKDFGDLYESNLNYDGATGGWEPQDGEVYPNMRLVDTSFEYPQGFDRPILVFVYETLTNEFVSEAADKVDYELNNLQRLTRPVIAIEGTDYAKTVGTTTITNDGDTLYLASAEEVNKKPSEGGFTAIVETWLEAGTLSVSTKYLSEGVVSVTTVFLAVEGSTVGPITDRNIDNFEGLKRISVTTLQDNDGNSLVDGGENLVNRYEKKVDFTYPGVVNLRQDTINHPYVPDEIDPILMNFELDPPVQAKVNGTVSVIFQSASTITGSDETYNDGGGASEGYWNPTSWAKSYVSGIGWKYTPFVESKGLRGYRVNSDVSGITEILPTGSDPVDEWNTFVSNGVTVYSWGSNNQSITKASSDVSGSIYAQVTGFSDTNGRKFTITGKRLFGSTPFLMKISGGPEDPNGNKYVLDIDIRPAFEDIDGNLYFKKTIVTATV